MFVQRNNDQIIGLAQTYFQHLGLIGVRISIGANRNVQKEFLLRKHSIILLGQRFTLVLRTKNFHRSIFLADPRSAPPVGGVGDMIDLNKTRQLYCD